MTTKAPKIDARFHVRLYATLPPEKYLTPATIKLAGELRDLARQHDDAVAKRRHLESPARDDEAALADREATAAALRAGRSAMSVGKPNADKLAADREAINREIESLVLAMYRTEEDITAEIMTLQGSEKTSGRAALAKATEGYRKALEALGSARAEYLEALAVERWLGGVAGLPSYGGGPWEGIPDAVRVNQISRSGELDMNIRPVTYDHFIRTTLGAELED